jgi:hypothetical protein
LEAALEEVESNAKDQKRAKLEVAAGRESVLSRWLPKDSNAKSADKPATQFADPAKRL